MSYEELHRDLASPDWRIVLEAVAGVEKWFVDAPVGDPHTQEFVTQLTSLGRHEKWEVRRAVARASSQSRAPAFDTLLDALRGDENRMVKLAADRAAVHRKKWPATHAFARERANQVEAVLEEIEGRYGSRGRTAVKRAAERMLSVFTREIHHEVVKLLSSIVASAERLSDLAKTGPTDALRDEAHRIEVRVEHAQATLAAMRTYAAQPSLDFVTEDLGGIVAEAVAVVRDRMSAPSPEIVIDGDSMVRAEVVRARLVQALVCVLDNAVEASAQATQPVRLILRGDEARISIRVQDYGVGMSAEGVIEARALFATTKPHGTGFGLPLACVIVESELDGHVTIESVRGQGTTVGFEFPVRRFGGARG